MVPQADMLHGQKYNTMDIVMKLSSLINNATEHCFGIRVGVLNNFIIP